MLNPLPLGSSTIKVTCDHYQRLLSESTVVEQELSSFGTALSRTLVTLTLKDSNWRPPAIPEIKELREGVSALMERTKEGLQRECLVIVEVTGCIRKLSHEFRQLIELMRSEQERSTQAIADLVGQARSKGLEIERCEATLESERNRQAEQAWRKLHYVKVAGPGGEEPAGATYIQVLKDLKNKLDAQANSERKEQRSFSLGVMGKLKDFKNRLLRAWSLLPLRKSLPRSPSPCPSDEEIKREISELQRRYLRREQEVDEFEVENLVEIKKKLKLLEEAEMSESREYLGYSASVEQNVVESEVVELLNS